MKSLKISLLALAAIIFSVFQNSTFAASVSVSASVKVEINDNYKPETSTYSGVIIDCRGLGLQTAASPVIKTEYGKIIYGDKDLDFDKINEIGMAEYTTSIQDSTARAGSHPLIVRAVKLDKFNSSPVISNADADRVIFADKASEFFKDLKVVFLTD